MIFGHKEMSLPSVPIFSECFFLYTFCFTLSLSHSLSHFPLAIWSLVPSPSHSHTLLHNYVGLILSNLLVWWWNAQEIFTENIWIVLLCLFSAVNTVTVWCNGYATLTWNIHCVTCDDVSRQHCGQRGEWQQYGDDERGRRKQVTTFHCGDEGHRWIAFYTCR